MPDTTRIRKPPRWRNVPLPPQPPSGRYVFTVDTPCDACGYNLRGLPLDSRCPECGTTASLGLEVYPHHWPAAVRLRFAAVIIAAILSLVVRFAWLAAVPGMLMRVEMPVIHGIATAAIVAGTVALGAHWALYLSQHRIVARLHRGRPPRQASLGGIGDLIVGATVLLLLAGFLPAAGAIALIVVGLLGGTIGALDAARRLEGLAFLLQRVELAHELRGSAVARCTCELLTLAGWVVGLLTYVFPPFLLVMMLVPIGLIAAAVMGLIEMATLLRLLWALYKETRTSSA